MASRNTCHAVRNIHLIYFPTQSGLGDQFVLMLTSPQGQSFEGGISGSPGVEAHGAYAFCALACLSILGPPEVTIARYVFHYVVQIVYRDLSH